MQGIKSEKLGYFFKRRVELWNNFNFQINVIHFIHTINGAVNEYAFIVRNDYLIMYCSILNRVQNMYQFAHSWL